LQCASSSAEVIVIRCRAGEADLTCGGSAMVTPGTGTSVAGSGGAVLRTGKRYVSENGDLELLCVKGGAGELAADGIALSLKEAKPLPSSD
jgi:hypothetical protein